MKYYKVPVINGSIPNEDFKHIKESLQDSQDERLVSVDSDYVGMDWNAIDEQVFIDKRVSMSPVVQGGGDVYGLEALHEKVDKIMSKLGVV
jgi:hypothetical protein